MLHILAPVAGFWAAGKVLSKSLQAPIVIHHGPGILDGVPNSPRPVPSWYEEPQAVVVAPDEVPSNSPVEFQPIYFKDDEPRSFAELDGQRHITVPLAKTVRALDDHVTVCSHKLLTGLPGRGKTLLAKVLGYELQTRATALGLTPPVFFEAFGPNLASVQDCDQLFETVYKAGGGVVFIDEIHVLSKELGTKLYSLMEEGRYPFHGSTQPTAFPPTTIIGATTDYGQLHAALKRRFGEPLHVRPLDISALRNLAKQLGYPITDEAVDLLVQRTHWAGAPYELKTLFAEARTFAKADKSPTITATHVHEVFDAYGIDEYGLRWADRQVLSALFQRPRYKGKAQEFVCYGASEADIVAVAGIDAGEFSEVVRPKLLARRFLEIKSGYGLALTPHAVTTYEKLNTASASA